MSLSRSVLGLESITSYHQPSLVSSDHTRIALLQGDVGPNTVLIGTSVHELASVGEGGFVCDSKLGAGTIVGSRCVLLGVDSVQSAHDSQASSNDQASLSPTHVIPRHQCVWVVPLLDGTQVTVCCGVDDNPKALYRESGPSQATFSGVPLRSWLQDRGLTPGDLWPSSESGPKGTAREEGSSSQLDKSLPDIYLQAANTGSDQRLLVSGVRTDSKQLAIMEKNLWTARLFPVEARGAVLEWIPWFMGTGEFLEISHRWIGAPRLSLAQIHRRIDFSALDRTVRTGRGKLALQMLTRDVNGLLRRNVAALSEQVLWGFNTQAPASESHATQTGVNSAEGMFAEVASSDWALKLADKLEESVSGPVNILPKSRSHMARADLLRAGGQLAAADRAEEHAWRAVASETAVGVGITTGPELREYPPDKEGVSGLKGSGIREQGLALREATRDALAHSHQSGVNGHQAVRPRIGEVYKVEMSVRLDIAGGWSDTPPWSLERVGRVLNIAANLDGKQPLGVEIVLTDEPGIVIRDDEERECRVRDAQLLEAPLAIDDPFAVGKAALVVTGFASSTLLGKLGGLVRRV
jgi:fucokinase